MIDHITIPSKQGKGRLHRIEEVFDCWFESGSMPYASQHYPFENKGAFESKFPADFVAEGLDQTRGWFYTILVLGTYLFDVSPFKNCVVNGMVLAENGKKMSKRLKNYPPVNLIIDRYGADALRLYLINSPVVRGEPLKFQEKGVKDVVQKALLPLWNSYRFFEQQIARLEGNGNVDFTFDPSPEARSENVMDQWILARCQSLLAFVNVEMAAYRLYNVVPRLLGLIDDTTNWYIRFNRQRLKGDRSIRDSLYALNTLFEVLYTLVRGLAPFTPFLADKIYLLLVRYIPEHLRARDPRSVHFHAYPEPREELFDEVVERRVRRLQTIVKLGHVSREREPRISLKQPLMELVVIHPDPQYLGDISIMEGYIQDELSIRRLVLSSGENYNVRSSVMPNLKTLNAKFKGEAKKLSDALQALSSRRAEQLVGGGSVVVEGVKLDTSSFAIKREISPPSNSKHLVTDTDGDVVIILDKEIYPELVQVRLEREIINRIQRLRKKAGLVATDSVKMEYVVVSDPTDVGIGEAFKNRVEAIGKAVGGEVKCLIDDNVDGVNPSIILEELQEVQGAVFLLRLSRLRIRECLS
ncbi:hypothetical protein GP486_004890 [Trichoglossum hirsutum]|uniref:isoleucine--tRNA ligase n=1 Tax=Trichoglossum hirsutum TaxID=265104 RepID=A0A9P8RN93_9PEZI|nr:hypothetical protein GP486_004890 [Trichoglossum hirsutum]